jgi:hypothetical protein
MTKEGRTITVLLVLIAFAAMMFLDIPVVTSTIKYDLENL